MTIIRRNHGIHRLVLFLVIVLHAQNLFAWTPLTTHRIATDATMLLPQTLQNLVRMYWTDVSTAISRQSADKLHHSEHYYWHGNNLGGVAPEKIAEDAHKSVQMIRNRKSLSQVFYQYGKLAFNISESFNPLNTSNQDQQEIYYYNDFERLTESFSPKFRIQFRGYSLISVQKKTISLEMKKRLTKMGLFYRPLTNEYRKRLSKGQPFNFGYQSIPFGIAMISYSNAVTTIVDVWCSIWKEAGGELANPPFDK